MPAIAILPVMGATAYIIELIVMYYTSDLKDSLGY